MLSSMRARLFVVVLLALVPLAALVVYHALDERAAARKRVSHQLQALAGFAVRDLETRISGLRHLLQALAVAPAVRDAAMPACVDLLSGIARSAQRYNNLLVVGGNGELLCSAVPPSAPVNYADRAWFRQVLASGRFALSPPLMGRSTGEPVMAGAWPIVDAAGRVERMVVAGLRLNWLGERFSVADIVPGMVVIVWDDDGRILFGRPDPGNLTGTLHPDAPLVRAARRLAGDAVVEATGFDGVARLVAVTRLAAADRPELTLAFGVARADVDARADREMWRNLAALALVAAAVLLLTWWVSERTVTQPVTRLMEASARQRAGDLGARAAGPVPAGEIGDLMRQFNDTAAVLETRTQDLHRINRTLRTLSECNQALVRATSERELLQDICNVIVTHGGYRFAWVGYAEDDGDKRVRPVAWAGVEDGYLDGANISWADDERGRGPAGTAVRTGAPFGSADIARDPRMAPWRERALLRGYAAAIALPLDLGGGARGVLCVYAAETGAFRDDEMPLLRELAGDVAFGIGALRAQAALRESEEKLRLFVLYAPSSIAMFDREMRYVAYSRRWLADFRLGDVDLAGRSHYAVFPDTPEHFREAYRRCLGGATYEADDVPLTRADGATEWIRLQVHPWRDAGGEVGGIVVFVEVVTARKRAEDALRTLNAELEQRVAERTVQLVEASRAKSDFLANMSHELRTPLNAIIGFSEMLKDGVLGPLEAKQRGFVADIFEAGSHLLALVNDILDLAKVEAGMLQLQAGPVDVVALLKSSTMVVKEKLLAHRLRLRTDLDPALGIVRADERKLKQIVYNLLANAVKFTPDGGTVTLTARRCGRDGIRLDTTQPGRLLPPSDTAADAFLEIAVADTGLGIAEDDLPKLFAPFVQVGSSVEQHQPGTGLGLSLVRRLVELHGGALGVASRPAQGSRFVVWLPHAEAAPAARAAAAQPAPSARPTPLALVVEDDDATAQVISAHLHGQGFEVTRASTAEEGLVRAARSRPDLVTLDIFLPAMDGWEFLRRLKADPALTATPVVIISAAPDGDHGIALGARRVLQKPFTRQALAEALAGIVVARPGGARVLVVDDNPKTVELVAAVLEAEGCQVMRAFGGAEAIEAARRAPPDLVILDLMMPEVSGFEVARALRATEHTARIPIVVLTAKDLTAEDHVRFNGEVSAVLAKSAFSTVELVCELRRAIAWPRPD